MRKIFVSVCVVLALGFVGCGKKKEEKMEKGATVAQNMLYDENGARVAQNQEIPVYQYEEDKFFDEDSVANFAFIDDEENKDNKKLAAADVDNWDIEEEAPLAWDDDESANVDFKTINFDINKNSIRDDQRVIVAENIATAQEAVRQGKHIVVAGHCCPLGSASFNMSLSERRAKAIRDEMVKNGVPADKVRILGCGAESPIVLSHAEDRTARIKELAPNRRAEISIS